MVTTVVSMLLQVISLFVTVVVAFTKSHRIVYLCTLTFNMSCLVLAVFQADWGTMVSYIIIVYRSVCILYKDELTKRLKHTIPLSIVILHIVFGAITWTDVFSIIPIAAPILLGLSQWYSNDLQKYRIVGVVNNSLWSMHTLYHESYILLLARIYSIIVNAVALYKNREKVA